MHRDGHLGAALLFYAPFGIILAVVDLRFWLIGILGTAALANLPDIDMNLPISHRGPTHTVWFALALGTLAGLAGAGYGVAFGPVAIVGLGGFLFAVVTTAITSHLLADALTPMGIRPFAPVRDTHVTLDVVKAANNAANQLLLWAGIAVTLAVGVVGLQV